MNTLNIYRTRRMKPGTAMLMAAFIVLMASAVAYAEPPAFPTITAQALKTELDRGKKVIVVDVRTKEEYAQGHLPGAINIPPDSYPSIAGYLPRDKSYPVVFYCRGFS